MCLFYFLYYTYLLFVFIILIILRCYIHLVYIYIFNIFTSFTYFIYFMIYSLYHTREHHGRGQSLSGILEAFQILRASQSLPSEPLRASQDLSEPLRAPQRLSETLRFTDLILYHAELRLSRSEGRNNKDTICPSVRYKFRWFRARGDHGPW